MNLNWQEEIILFLKETGFNIEALGNDFLISIHNKQQVIKFLSPNSSNLQEVKLQQLQYEKADIQMINVWKDVWENRKPQVKSRFYSLAKKNSSLAGRKCNVVSVESELANKFLNEHHLQGSTQAKIKYGLEYEGELVAIATFKIRPMAHIHPEYQSAELIRFCSKMNTTVVGGISKLIKYFINKHHPNDLMTYADRDWSDGKGYSKLGFKLIKQTDPIFFYLYPNTQQRKKISSSLDKDKIQVFNTGNLKYIFKIHE